MPRSHLALFQKYLPGITSRSGVAVVGRQRLAVAVCCKQCAFGLEK